MGCAFRSSVTSNVKDVDLTHGRTLDRPAQRQSLHGTTALNAEELRALKRYLTQRGDVQLPWLFLTERGDQFTRFAINYLVARHRRTRGLGVSCPSAHAAAWLWLCPGQSRL